MSLAGVPWRLVWYGAAALAASGLLLGGVLSVRGAYRAKARLGAAELDLKATRAEYAGYQEASEKAAAAWAARDAVDRSRDLALSDRLDVLGRSVEAARLAASKFRPTREVTRADGSAAVSINPDWWLCVSASGSGDPADAAACQARAGDAAVRARDGAPGVQVPP